jgi:hypothetical protein
MSKNDLGFLSQIVLDASSCSWWLALATAQQFLQMAP